MKKEKKNFGGDVNLKKAGIEQEYTQEQVIEYAKCMNDPIYFSKNYVTITSIDDGVIPFDMYPFQEDVISLFHDNPFSIIRQARQSGKCSEYNTIVEVRNKKTGKIDKVRLGELYDTKNKD